MLNDRVLTAKSPSSISWTQQNTEKGFTPLPLPSDQNEYTKIVPEYLYGFFKACLKSAKSSSAPSTAKDTGKIENRAISKSCPSAYCHFKNVVWNLSI
jgi:hypothetical protein